MRSTGRFCEYFSHGGLACFVCLLLVPAGAAQTITGSTTIDIDPTTGNVTIICETDLDGNAMAFYEASVTCTAYANGTFIGNKSASDTRGISGTATAAFVFAGVPGTTYTATGTHSGIIQYLDYEYSDVLDPSAFYDAYNFGYFESPLQTYPDTYDWFGPGPPVGSSSSYVQTGKTTTNQIRYYTQSELQALISNAQAILSPHCDAVFAQVLVPTYTNQSFFNSLTLTAFLQYPKGVAAPPDIGSVLNEPIADTLIDQSGRPIRLFANFYPTASGFPAGYQESILTHEGIHHYTGWLDAHDPTRPQIPDFITQFYSSGYRKYFRDNRRFF